MNAIAPPQEPVQRLPWRRILLWNLLIILWGLPLYGLGLIVHELGHLAAAALVGLHAYGISFAFLAPTIGSGADCFQDLVVSIGGAGLATLSAVAVLPLCRWQRPSLLKLALVLYCGGAIIHSALYITSAYYCQFGDFGDWKAEYPHMRFLIPVLVLCLPAIGYLLGGLYLPVQEAWLPASTPARRRQIVALTIGLIALLFALTAGCARQILFHPALPSPYTFLIEAGFALLLFAGGAGRLNDAPLSTAVTEPRRLPLAAVLLPLPLFLLMGLISRAEVSFPHRPAGTWAGARYTDSLVSKDDVHYSLCSDGQGTVFWLPGKDQPVRRLSPDGQQTNLTIPGMTPWRIKAHGQLIYLWGERPQGRCLAAYDTRRNQLNVLLDGLEEISSFDVTPSGELYFVKRRSELWLLPAGAKQARLVWLAPRSISDIVGGSAGLVYVSSTDGGFGESGHIYAVGTARPKRKLIADNLTNPTALAIDEQENIYVGGLGWSSLSMIPATNRNERAVLRGYGWIRNLTIGPGGSVFYWAITGTDRDDELRVLRPKQRKG